MDTLQWQQQELGRKKPEMKKPETSSWRTEPAPKECGVKAESLPSGGTPAQAGADA
jgi:hypothetical protein